MKFLLLLHMPKINLKTCALLSSTARDLGLGLRIPLLPYFMSATREGCAFVT